jgi:hypothetical protein
LDAFAADLREARRHESFESVLGDPAVSSTPAVQVGLVVPDLEAAMAELTAAFGVRWGSMRQFRVDEWEIRAVFSVERGPYFELIQGSAGSPWDARKSGPKLDHLMRWSQVLDDDIAELESSGYIMEVDGRAYGGTFAYLRARSSGLCVELVDAAGEPDHRARWGLENL